MATSSTVGTSDGYEAKEILRDYYAILASSISDPVQVSKDLFQEKVISEQSLREIESCGQTISQKNSALLRCMRMSIPQDHVKLWKFAFFLRNYEETNAVANKILNCFEKRWPDSIPDELLIREAATRKQNILHGQLDINDLVKLDKILKDVNDWERLGLYLGIKQTTLERIRLDRHDITPCKREMLSCWLKGNSDDLTDTSVPSYNRLIEALTEIGEQEAVDVVRANVNEQLINTTHTF